MLTIDWRFNRVGWHPTQRGSLVVLQLTDDIETFLPMQEVDVVSLLLQWKQDDDDQQLILLIIQDCEN